MPTPDCCCDYQFEYARSVEYDGEDPLCGGYCHDNHCECVSHEYAITFSGLTNGLDPSHPKFCDCSWWNGTWILGDPDPNPSYIVNPTIPGVGSTLKHVCQWDWPECCPNKANHTFGLDPVTNEGVYYYLPDGPPCYPRWAYDDFLRLQCLRDYLRTEEAPHGEYVGGTGTTWWVVVLVTHGNRYLWRLEFEPEDDMNCFGTFRLPFYSVTVIHPDVSGLYGEELRCADYEDIIVEVTAV